MSEPVESGPRVVQVEVSRDQAGQRVDNFLIARLKGVPRSRIYRLLRKGEVRVNRGRVRAEYRLEAGDLVRIPPVRQAEAAPTPVPGASLRARLDTGILLETDDLIVLDKPSGLAVHGGSGVSLGVIEALRASRSDTFLELVHRLDRGTSGCLLVAKKRSALRALQQQLRDGTVGKTYLTLVAGRWPKGLECIDAPLRKRTLPSGEQRVRPDVAGKSAVTRFRVVRRFETATLLEVDLETGRTHQIRVHCQSAGHPLVGDDKYGDDLINSGAREAGLRRLFLHAQRLRFRDPSTGKTLIVEAPVPDDLQSYINCIQ
ncbi:MAG: 23S rRNA pseudouridine(955/2504/2580) synthase RluC [Porticoccaceae bacterium]|nr:23S rRNA pseudouridine(955/2504/2580) synthase RluC [Porticoccaceae bacterium]